jgi:hypothetical protein
MQRYIIERNVPGAGSLDAAALADIAGRSCNVLRDLGPDIQWVQSLVTDDMIYCTYLARDEDLVREHARAGGFPADRVSRVREVIDPTTAP